MTILSFERKEIVALAEKGLMHKNAVRHYDVCKALSEGKTQERIAEEFNLNDDRAVRWIKDHKCPDCKK